MARVAIASCEAHPQGDKELALTVQALEAKGIETSVEVWTDGSVLWNEFDLVVVRTTWDYTDSRDAFVAWASSVARIENPASVLGWNTDKRYLDDLGQRSLPIVPSAYVEAFEDFIVPAYERYVIKPTVGAGARGVERFGSGEDEAARAHVARLLDHGRVAMVQPYLDQVDEFNEVGIVVIDDVVSHAIEKRPLLSVDSKDRRALLEADGVKRRQPTPEEMALTEKVLEAAHEICAVGDPFLYARIDLLPSMTGPVVLEFEAAEPSMYLALDESAPRRFADAVARRL